MATSVATVDRAARASATPRRRRLRSLVVDLVMAALVIALFVVLLNIGALATFAQWIGDVVAATLTH